VVAADHDQRNSRFRELRDLLDKEQASTPILPVSVVQIAGDQQKRDPLLDRCIDQVSECLARCFAQQARRRLGIGFEPVHRAIEMDVGSVQKAEFSHGDARIRLAIDACAQAVGLSIALSESAGGLLSGVEGAGSQSDEQARQHCVIVNYLIDIVDGV
jgi:hypothetical protein